MKKRPKSVTLLALGVLSFTGIYLWRFAQSIVQWDFLNSLPLQVPPAYLGISGLFWALVGAVLAWGLWRGHSWAPRLAKIAAIVLIIYLVIDRIFLATGSLVGTNLLFRGVLTLMLVGLVFWILSRAEAKAYFGVMNDG